MTQAGKITRSGASGINRRGDTAARSDQFRLHTDRGCTPIDVGMQIDKAGREDEARDIANLGGRVGDSGRAILLTKPSANATRTRASTERDGSMTLAPRRTRS